LKNGTDDFFGEPIYTYTDEQAIEDGGLVAIAGPERVNRVTRAVFDYFTQPMGNSPVTGPVTNITPLMDAICAVLQAELKDDWRIATYQNKTLWLVPNEVGGLTLMFPEDY